ncbi:MAG TPA: DinB family protein [Thermomicrobiales bacterium]|nr:DinB family protein [Thermomicrobiales bacterium]
MSESLVEIFRHNAWANQRLFDACDGLSDAQLDATVVGTFGSIRNTLEHIVGAQERYVAALGETGPVDVLRERDLISGLAELRDAARTSSEALIELATHAQSGATVTTAYRGEDYTLPVWLLLVQAINHATEHRAQVAAILTQQGIQPPSMDGWTYHETRFNADWSLLWSW